MPWITPFLAAIFLLVGILAIFNRRVRSITNQVPIIGRYAWIVLLSLGLMFGGIAGVQGIWGSVTSTTASVVSNNAAPVSAQSNLCEIDYCRVLTVSDGGTSSNVTFTADNNNANNYFIDSNNNTAVADQLEMNGTLNCVLKVTPTTGTECAPSVYIIGPEYKSEIDTADSTLYRLVDEESTASVVPGVKYRQLAYLNDNAVATTSSNREETFMTYTAGTKQRTLGFAVEFDGTAHNELDRYSQKAIYIKQKLNAGDKTVFTFTLRKGGSGS